MGKGPGKNLSGFAEAVAEEKADEGSSVWAGLGGEKATVVVGFAVASAGTSLGLGTVERSG